MLSKTSFIHPLKLNIERETIKNNNYRKVIYTTSTQQLVLMSLDPGIEIGEEVHPDTTQYFRIEYGSGVATVDSGKFLLKPGDTLVVPPGARHNIWCPINSSTPLKLYTIYSPPEHPPGTIQKFKVD